MLSIPRVFSTESTSPYSTVNWTTVDVSILHEKTRVPIYECPNARFPATWSDLARQIVANKYFRESRLASERENDIQVMIERVVSTITTAGIDQGYFDSTNAAIFADELRMILLHQMASFNSPVWFNVGVPGVEKPQASACFINAIEDNMESILGLALTEGLIFKDGSGSGVNFSSLRGSNERIRGGGTASGPVSFMQGYDAFANVILSGGRTRRAARMAILNVDHPDIRKFISCKAEQEDIVAMLAAMGMTTDFTAADSAYTVVKHQSSNNSVRVTDEFMRRVQEVLHGYKTDLTWNLKNRVDGSVAETVSVRELFRGIAEAAWKCGDPGLQFHDTINRMNTCAMDGEIHASNPCSEFMWLDNSACNLASINLEKFIVKGDERVFDVKTFKHVVRILIIAQDILVEYASYPTTEITIQSHKYRPLGLGYANLGGLLMSWGIPYDSDDGRNLAASITSLMTGQAYLASAEIAESKGTFGAFEKNKAAMEEVLGTHYTSTRALKKDIAGLSTKAVSTWQDAIGKGFGRRSKGPEDGVGFRNAQVTLLAPTGTIAFMMDCATTGIEPDVALKKTKFMVGGHKAVYVNPSIIPALRYLGYSDEDRSKISAYILEHGHAEGSTLKPEHLAVFDCAQKADKATRVISPDGHLKMLAAVQPFLSGAISKTVNLDNDATVEDIELILLRAWEYKLKCITIYRDGSKMSEPLRVKEIREKAIVQNVPRRRRLPDDLDGPRHKFEINGNEGFLHVGEYPKGEPKELFVRIARYGATVGGLLDSYAILFSKALQYNIPLEELIEHMEGSKFPPAGMTRNPNIRMAGSILDYIARYMRQRYLEGAPQSDDEVEKDRFSIIPEPPDNGAPIDDVNEDTCPSCGALLRRTGTCTYCSNCSYSGGVCG